MDESTSEFVTVVEVEEQKNGEDFVTVVHIGQENVGSEEGSESGPSPPQTEDVQILRLPGERLGMALKFEGGACASQPIDRVFIQNINRCSPASRAYGKKIGPLREGDEILRIQRKPVSGMTRISCVSCLRDEGSPAGARDSLVAVTLTVCRTWNNNGHKSLAPLNERNGSTNNTLSAQTSGKKGPPPPIPPRLSSTTLSTVPAGREDKKGISSVKSAANGLCSDLGKMNGKTGSKKSPPPLPPRRPKDPPPAAPVARKTQRVNNCLQAQSSSAVITEAKTSSRAQNESSSSSSGASDSRLLSSSRTGPPVEPHVYTDTLSDRSVSIDPSQTMTYHFCSIQVCMESESDDTGSSISTIIDRFSRASTASSSISDFAVVHKSPTIDIDDVLQPFERLERELDQKEALEKYVNETAAMLLEESKPANGIHMNTPASNLDDYDDIESVSMTLSGMENESPKGEKKGDGAKTSQSMERLPETECKNAKKTLPPNAKKECNVTKTKDTRTENGEKKNTGTERLHPKPIFRAKSPCLTSKPRHGILKKPKDGLQKGNANSSLQRKIANKCASTSSSSNNLRNSLSQNSRSTSNLNQINSMIPKLDPFKNAPVTPLPRKSRSTSNLVTAVDADSRPSLIPRPVNKTVTFAVNLVKQIQSPSDLMDLALDASQSAPPDLLKCDPVEKESDDKAQGVDQKGGLNEEKVGEERDEGLRANDPQGDEKRGEFSLHTSIRSDVPTPFFGGCFFACLMVSEKSFIRPVRLVTGVRSEARHRRVRLSIVIRDSAFTTSPMLLTQWC